MGIRKKRTSKGTIKYVVDLYVKENNKRKRIRREFFSFSEAKDFDADGRKNKNITNARTALGKHTRRIDELAKHYYTLVRFASLRPGSKVRNQQLIGHFLKWCNENSISYVHEFNKEHANRYCSYIFEKWKGKGRQHVFIIAKMLFREELQREDAVISKNPFPEQSPFKAKSYKPIAIPNDVYKKLREHMDDLERAVYDVMVSTGCRSGELLYLCWPQVDKDLVRFETHIILDERTQEHLQWESKTGTDREIPLNKSSKQAFEYLRSINKNCDYVLPKECRLVRHWITRRFEKVKQRTVLAYPELNALLYSKDPEKNITPKKLRSTFVTNIAKVTNNPVIAQKAAGHASIQTTLKHYMDKTFFDLKDGVRDIDFA